MTHPAGPPLAASATPQARPLRIGVAYLGRSVRDIDRIAKVADWVLLPMDEAEVANDARTVSKLVARAHEGGLKVILDPWRVGDVFAGEAKTELPSMYPSERQVSSDGAVRNSLSPLSPHFQRYMSSWIQLAKRAGADGVFWDEPHYWQGEWAGDGRLHASWDRWHRDLWGADKPVPLHANAETRRFQVKTLATVLKGFTAEARKEGLERVYVALTPNAQHRTLWRSLAPDVDSLGVSAYPSPVEDMTTLLRSTKHPEKAHVWLQAFNVPRGSEQKIVENAEKAYELGVREIAFWSWQGSKAFGPLRSEDPAAVQAATMKAIERLRALDNEHRASAAQP